VIFQWFLRGVNDNGGALDDNWARHVLNTDGLRSAWLRKNPGSDPAQWDDAVNQTDALLWHVTEIDHFGFPAWPGDRFGDMSPFLSLSSGTVEPDHRHSRNQRYPAWYTAAKFATRSGASDGWVFHGYASILGQQAMPLLEFSEEVRDLHQHGFYNRYHPEGELAAKIWVPPVRLKQAFKVTADLTWDWLSDFESGTYPAGPEDPLDVLAKLSATVIAGDSYRAPDEFGNIRGAL
jgi:hypothetical protein